MEMGPTCASRRLDKRASFTTKNRVSSTYLFPFCPFLWRSPTCYQFNLRNVRMSRLQLYCPITLQATLSENDTWGLFHCSNTCHCQTTTLFCGQKRSIDSAQPWKQLHQYFQGRQNNGSSVQAKGVSKRIDNMDVSPTIATLFDPLQSSNHYLFAYQGICQ